MQQHSDLKSTLQEKRAQMQSHKIVHQEILAHKSLVESVCLQAQQLIDQTQDKSLSMYIVSIKQLFANIVSKSEELMDRSTVCVKEHTLLTNSMTNFQDWLVAFRDETNILADTCGEKADTRKKLNGFNDVLVKNEMGRAQLDDINQLCSLVVASTSPRGCDILHKMTLNLQDEVDSLTAGLRDTKTNLEVCPNILLNSQFNE